MSQFYSHRGPYPQTRLRRNRTADYIRRLVAENQLTCNDLIAPVFISEQKEKKQAIASMPEQFRFSLDGLLLEAEQLFTLGIPAIALFPSLDLQHKTATAEYAYHEQGLIQQAVRRLKKEIPDLGIISDVALDPYTVSGQDGLTDDEGNVLNDETTAVLVKQALSHAECGVDIIAPSDMMDGRIGVIRTALEQHQHHNTLILSYAAKFASAFYGPFRDAVGSLSLLGKADKNSYQMPIANTNEALHEVALDLQEGADIIMVKPGMPYLDVLQRIKTQFQCPTFAYQVSGEYSMLKMAVTHGVLPEKETLFESLLAFKRAGADAIISYFAKKYAQSLHSG